MFLENKSPILAGWCNRDERENKLLFFRVLVLAGHDRNPFPVVPAKAKTSALEDGSFVFTMSTSKLQRDVSRLLSIHLGGYNIRENIRPDWLMFEGERIELDFYIADLSLAIEVQGEQHYHFVPVFHRSQDGFKRMLARDEQKKRTCDELGIKLYEVACLDDAYMVIENVLASQPERAGFNFVKTLKREIAFRGCIDNINEQIMREEIESRYGMVVIKSKKIKCEGMASREVYRKTLDLKIANLELRLKETKSEKPRSKIEKRIAKCKELERKLQESGLI